MTLSLPRLGGTWPVRGAGAECGCPVLPRRNAAKRRCRRCGFCGIGHAPVNGVGVAGELWADLADLVAQADHVVEALPGERVQVRGLVPSQVDAVVLAQHPHRGGMQLFGMTPALAASTSHFVAAQQGGGDRGRCRRCTNNTRTRRRTGRCAATGTAGSGRRARAGCNRRTSGGQARSG